MSPLNNVVKTDLAAACAFGAALICLVFVIYNKFVVVDENPAAFTAKVVTASTNRAGQHTKPLPAPNFDSLAQLHLFGHYVPPAPTVVEEERAPAEPEVDLSALPKTQMNLKLSGIGYSASDSRASAIIVTPDGQHGHFVIGEEIIANTSVHLIERDRVIIKHNDQLEVLELPEIGAGNPNVPTTNRRIARRTDPRTNKPPATR